ncbi:MAG: V-type ATP synthase subunit I [Huintestinicola sp.]
MSSIEKMMFADIAGMDSELDAVLEIISSCGCFHMENAAAAKFSSSDKSAARRENPYTAVVKMISEIAVLSGIKLAKTDCTDIHDCDADRIRQEVSSMRNRMLKLKAEVKRSEEMYAAHQTALEQITHISGGESGEKLTVDLEQIFSCTHIKVRYGRLPVDSYEKLPYYEDKNFYFLPYGKDKDYCWGFCFMPASEAEETDEIFKTLYFERIRLPDFLHGDAEEALKQLENDIAEDKKAIEEKKKKLDEYAQSKEETLCKYFSKFKAMHDTFELREKVLIIRDKFYIVGFVPAADEERFKKYFEGLKTVSIVIKPCGESDIETPVKLKNNKFSEPFSMFVELYGLPAYNDINPTNIVAVTYTLMFGIMFGDLGQGLCLLLLGIFLGHKKKMTLGLIMERLGVSSMIFGTLYGSVFGYEELLDPMYESLGIGFLPFKAMENITTVLFAAIGLGIVFILISIIINIVMGFKEKNYTRAVFSNNGIAGLVFFSALLLLVLGMFTDMISVGGPVYIICFIVLPLLIMFFREPLGELCRGKGFKMEESIGEFIAANFFECFEFLLGYATNTLSFVRVGGFVLSHAGMMTVVLALADMSSGASPIVMIIGNIFVMGLEGLLVGIQVLRLEFYELFSRFYAGGGKAFTPVSINYDEIIE